MNWEQIEGKWDQLKGNVKSQWGKLTDDDLLRIQGKRDQLVGVLKERYGYDKDVIEKEINDFISKTSDSNKTMSSCCDKTKSCN